MAKGDVIAYYRVSTHKQGAEGLGIESQKEAVANYIKNSNEPLTLVNSFTEVESGTRKGNGKRPKLDEALLYCKLCDATLVIARLDRLHRNVAAQSALMESGVNFVACDNPHANRFTLHILAAVAEDEAAKIARNTTAALASRKESGKPMGSQCWKSGKGLLNVENQEKGRALAAETNKAKASTKAQSIIAIAKHMGIDLENLSYHQIAKELNAKGVATTSGKGKRWAYSSVRNLLNRV